MTESNSIRHHWWGLRPYAECEKLQQQAWLEVFEGHSGIILAGEITPVITQGVRAKTQDILNPLGFEIFQISRGGETTLHSPGQLVIYPVLNIRKSGIGVRDYVRQLLEISAQAYQSFGVDVQVNENPVGLFTEAGKIGFCGLQIKQGISQHGLALNIQNDLKNFENIISCGLQKVGYDKLDHHHRGVSPEQFFRRWVETASRVGILQKNQSLVVKPTWAASSPELSGPSLF